MQVLSIFLTFLRLGCTSFGGPVAHLGYFQQEFVRRQRWLSEQAYADLVALCQFLPGPASSQIGMAIGLLRGGYTGAVVAWLGFTLPSALLLLCAALGLTHYGSSLPAGLLHGLKIVAAAVVAQAVWELGQKLCPDWQRLLLMLLAAGTSLLLPGVMTQVCIVLAAAFLGYLIFKPTPLAVGEDVSVPISRRAGLFWISLFFLMLLGLPLIGTTSPLLAMTDSFYRAGALVFGGGHVVLPLLEAEFVSTGQISRDAFLAGYGLTQAVPGPLFTFAAFLGAALHGVAGGVLAVIAIFLPSFLLVAGALPFWHGLRAQAKARAALMGLNAAVVGLLLAALFTPVLSSAILQPLDIAFVALALVALMHLRLAPWLVVLAGAGLGLAISA